jgi:maltooligosyltrehalose trehalohydrolase
MTGDLGAVARGDGRARFTVWAPRSRRVEVRLGDRLVPLEAEEGGYHRGDVDGVPPAALYRYRLDDGVERPDPASRHQPQGVHGPSQIDDVPFAWTDAGWKGVETARLVLYELHVGAFSRAGTLDGAIPALDRLRDLGVTAVELMPLSQAPGDRNWGYDGVFPFSVQASYGGPAALRRFVDACHARGLGVVLDVVYNHLGPEGNCLLEYGPYLTDRHHTPWGMAMNFDGEGCAGVRRYFLENAVRWVREFHVDGLRLDAVHAIVDTSERPILAELADQVHAEGVRQGRPVHVIAESERNDAGLVRLGFDAQWSDDFHHSLRTLLTGERRGYYAEFGRPEQLAAAFRDGFVRPGPGEGGRPDLRRLVVFSQNHDQVGNRPLGDRLGAVVDEASQRLAAAAVILSPSIPLLFMGEEYGETAPFQYFTSHGDPGLVEAVRRGRREEFKAFIAAEELPDPQAVSTFERSKLDPDGPVKGARRHAYYRALLELRARIDRSAPEVEVLGQVLAVRYPRALLLLNFGREDVEVSPRALQAGRWTVLLDSGPTNESGTFVGPTNVPDSFVGLRGRSAMLLYCEDAS